MFGKPANLIIFLSIAISVSGCSVHNVSNSKKEDEKKPPVTLPTDNSTPANVTVPPPGDDNILEEPHSNKVLLKDALKDGLKVKVLDPETFKSIINQKAAILVSGEVVDKVSSELAEGLTACTAQSSTEEEVSVSDFLEPFNALLLEEATEELQLRNGNKIKLFTARVEIQNSKGTYLISFVRLREPNTLIDAGVAAMSVLEFYF